MIFIERICLSLIFVAEFLSPISCEPALHSS